MYFQLRSILIALTGERARKRSVGRFSSFLWIFTILLLTGFIGLWAGYAYNIWRYWPSLLFSGVLGGGFTSALLPIPATIRFPFDLIRIQQMASNEPLGVALAVRRALAAGDTTIAQATTTQSEEDSDGLFSSAPADGESLVVAIPNPLITALAGPITLYVFAALLLVLASIVTAAALGTVGFIYLAGMCGGLLLGAIPLVLLGWRLSRHRALQRRGMTVTLDALGLTYNWPVWAKRQRQIAWSDMRALARFTYKDGSARLRAIYLLESEEQTLMWAEPPIESYASLPRQQTIAAERESAKRLALVITSRTRLPMRDLTDTIAALIGTSQSSTTTPTFLSRAWTAALAAGDVETAAMIWRAREPGAKRQPRALRRLIASSSSPSAINATPDTLAAFAASQRSVSPRVTQLSALLASLQRNQQELLRTARALIPYYPFESAPDTPVSFRRRLRRERSQRSLIRITVWAQLMLIATILITSGVGWYDERNVESLERALPQQTITQTPLYFASLAHPQSDWMVQRSSKDDPSAAAFVNGAYQVTSADPNSSAIFWISQDEEGDIAISTSVAIHGPISQQDQPTAGILFDGRGDGYIFSTFGVDEEGDWSLWRYDPNKDFNDPWSYVDGNSSSAIHTGDGATNTLLLVRHGPLYLLYVNNTLVDRYYDTDHALPPGGDVGVYIDSGSIVGDFNDFALYPVPPQLSATPLTTNLPIWLK